MKSSLEFYFDFGSPYGYIASEKIESIASKHSIDIIWKPILIGVLFKLTGSQPLISMPMKGDYFRRDMLRSARWHGVTLNWPPLFPMMTQNAARASYWAMAHAADRVAPLVHALYRAYFIDGRDISQTEEIARCARGAGLDAGALVTALGENPIKEKLKQEMDTAIAKKVWGSPYIIIDGEPFHGADRLDQVDRWLATGGF